MIPWPFELWFYTPLGTALVIAANPCGINGDMEWTCIIQETGEIWNWKNADIRAASNTTYGINLAKHKPNAK